MADLTMTGATYASAEAGFGQALTGGYGESGNDYLPQDTFTVTARVSSVASSGSIGVIVGQANAFWVGKNGSNLCEARYGSGGGEVALVSSVDLTVGGPHHIELNLHAGGARLFVNGVIEASSTTSPSAAGVNLSSGSPFQVRRFVTAFNFDGAVDEVALFTDQLHDANFTHPSAPYSNNVAGIYSLWHLDNNGVDSANAGSVIDIAPDNPALIYSRCNWLTSSTESKTINVGAWFKTLFTGSSLTLNFDMTGISARRPVIVARIDGRDWQKFDVEETVPLSIPSDQDNDTHLLEVLFDAATETVSRWSPQSVAVVFTGLTLSSGSETVAAPELVDDYVLFYGDSITEGVRTLATNGSLDVDRNSQVVGWPRRVADLLGCDSAVVAFGSQGISDSGNGGVPNLVNSYDFLWSGQSRDFSIPPKYCIWLQGHNDGSSNTVADGLEALNGMLASMVDTIFFLVRPFSGNQAANLQSIQSTCNEPNRVFYIDSTGFFNTSNSADGLHPYGFEDFANIAPKIAQAINNPTHTSNAILSAAGIPDGTYRVRLFYEDLNCGDSPVFDGDVVFSGGTGSASFGDKSGRSVTGYVVDNIGSHINGAVLQVTTS
jgi:hypothetical protein